MSKDYYLLQYLVAGMGGFSSIEGYGSAEEQSARFDLLFPGARFEPIPNSTLQPTGISGAALFTVAIAPVGVDATKSADC